MGSTFSRLRSFREARASLLNTIDTNEEVYLGNAFPRNNLALRYEHTYAKPNISMFKRFMREIVYLVQSMNIFFRVHLALKRSSKLASDLWKGVSSFRRLLICWLKACTDAYETLRDKEFLKTSLGNVQQFSALLGRITSILLTVLHGSKTYLDFLTKDLLDYKKKLLTELLAAKTIVLDSTNKLAGRSLEAAKAFVEVHEISINQLARIYMLETCISFKEANRAYAQHSEVSPSWEWLDFQHFFDELDKDLNSLEPHIGEHPDFNRFYDAIPAFTGIVNEDPSNSNAFGINSGFAQPLGLSYFADGFDYLVLEATMDPPRLRLDDKRGTAGWDNYLGSLTTLHFELGKATAIPKALHVNFRVSPNLKYMRMISAMPLTLEQEADMERIKDTPLGNLVQFGGILCIASWFDMRGHIYYFYPGSDLFFFGPYLSLPLDEQAVAAMKSRSTRTILRNIVWNSAHDGQISLDYSDDCKQIAETFGKGLYRAEVPGLTFGLLEHWKVDNKLEPHDDEGSQNETRKQLEGSKVLQRIFDAYVPKEQFIRMIPEADTRSLKSFLFCCGQAMSFWKGDLTKWSMDNNFVYVVPETSSNALVPAPSADSNV